MREVPEVGPVLRGQRLVEPVVVAERRDRGRVVDRLLPEVRRGGIARHELRQHERDQRDADREEDERDEPPQRGSEGTAGTTACAVVPA